MSSLSHRRPTTRSLRYRSAPNGNLLTANGDAVNDVLTQPSEIVEFTTTGRFVNRPPADNEWPIAEPERIAQLALQPPSLGSEIDVIDGVAILGELHDELVEGLADDRRRGATLRGCLDVGGSRVICG